MLSAKHEGNTVDNPIPPQVPASQTAVAEMRKYMDALPDYPYEVCEGGIDDNGIPYVKLRPNSQP
jgi:hypothetical protein